MSYFVHCIYCNYSLITIQFVMEIFNKLHLSVTNK